jgi:hypothetical protein
MSSSLSTILDSFDKIVSQKGSGAYVILGILIIIIGIGIGVAAKSELTFFYLSLSAGMTVII